MLLAANPSVVYLGNFSPKYHTRVELIICWTFSLIKIHHQNEHQAYHAWHLVPYLFYLSWCYSSNITTVTVSMCIAFVSLSVSTYIFLIFSGCFHNVGSAEWLWIYLFHFAMSITSSPFNPILSIYLIIRMHLPLCVACAPLLPFSHKFVSDFIFLRDSTRPSQRPHLIHIHFPFLAFHNCPCLCTIQQCWHWFTTVLCDLPI